MWAHLEEITVEQNVLIDGTTATLRALCPDQRYDLYMMPPLAQEFRQRPCKQAQSGVQCGSNNS